MWVEELRSARNSELRHVEPRSKGISYLRRKGLACARWLRSALRGAPFEQRPAVIYRAQRGRFQAGS